MVEETFIWSEIWKNQEALIPFLNCAFNNSSPNNDKKKKKKIVKNLAFFKGYIYTRRISTISTINAPKWRQSAGTWKLPTNMLNCTPRNHQGTFAAGKIRQNIKFAAFLVCVFDQNKCIS